MALRIKKLVAAVSCITLVAWTFEADAGLVAHFPLDGDTLDASGNGNDGTFVGTDETYVDGFDGTLGGALDLSGDDYVNVAQVSGLPLTDNAAFSVTGWVKAAVQADKRIFSEGSTLNNSPLYNIGSDNTGDTGALDIFIRRDAGQGTAVGHAKTAAAAFDGDWHHFAVVDDGGNLRTYIDGVPDLALSYVLEPFAANTTTLGAILRASACCHMTGAIDDIRLYDHALSLAEILEQVPVVPGCISRYSFDGDLLDPISGNDGTFVGGAATFVDGFDGTVGGALSFDGADDYVDILANSGLPLTDNPSFTFTAWVNGAVQNDRRIFSEGSTLNNSPLYNIGTHNTGANGALDLFIRRDQGQGTAVNHFKTARESFDASWHHVAVVDDDGDVTIYIDGVEEGSGLSYAREPLTTDTTTLGGILRAAPCCHFGGALDEVNFYNRALSAEEIAARVPEPEGCPDDGDTTCGMLVAAGPDGGEGPGEWTFTATDVMDGGGDTPIYRFIATNGEGERRHVGPQESNVGTFTFLDEAIWTVTCLVDDDIRCQDPEGTCEATIAVITEPPRVIATLPFDGDLVDATGNGNDGTAVGGPEFVQGVDCADPGALSFDGTDDYVDLMTNDGLPIYNTPAYSIAMWVRGTASPEVADRRVYSEANDTENTTLFNIGTHFQGAGGQVDIFIRDGSGGNPFGGHKLSDGEAFDGNWHHIAWVDDNGNAVLYIDGVPDTADFTYTKAPLNLAVSTIGAVVRPGRSPVDCCWFDGEIDDARLYNFALTPEEVAALVPAELPECIPNVGQVAGDCDQSGDRSITDLICMVGILFPGFNLLTGAPAAPCLTPAGDTLLLDVNGDTIFNASDAVGLARFLFSSGEPPAQGEGCFNIPEPDCAPSAACL